MGLEATQMQLCICQKIKPVSDTFLVCLQSFAGVAEARHQATRHHDTKGF